MSQEPTASSESLLESLTVIPGVRWFHLSDPSSSALDQLAAHFGIHPLQVEDCRNRRQTARVEEHDSYSFIVIKVLATVSSDKRAAGSVPSSGVAEPAPEDPPRRGKPAKPRPARKIGIGRRPPEV